MDIDRFDRFARLLGGRGDRRPSRRDVAGGIIAAILAVASGASPALACVNNSRRCDPKLSGQCCSGTCKQSGKRHVCRPTRGAFGCTVDHDLRQGDATRCPGDANGYCVGRDDGKPFCTPQVDCVPCATGADCDHAFHREGGVCIAACAFCVSIGGKNACVFPPPTSWADAGARGRRHGKTEWQRARRRMCFFCGRFSQSHGARNTA
ncbi:MAG TPA: hypothetical protein VFU81_09315 [Thermomicrobiales bacterium]|nr:hypothetical protein [Thermomicrobiales bacterium]